MDETVSNAIVKAIKKVADQIHPDVRYLPKYGGEVLALDPHDDKKFVAGIFSYNSHVSLEFSNGAFFADPEGYLEGKGKSRRHLKFKTLEEVTEKDVQRFLKQAMVM